MIKLAATNIHGLTIFRKTAGVAKDGVWLRLVFSGAVIEFKINVVSVCVGISLRKRSEPQTLAAVEWSRPRVGFDIVIKNLLIYGRVFVVDNLAANLASIDNDDISTGNSRMTVEI